MLLLPLGAPVGSFLLDPDRIPGRFPCIYTIETTLHCKNWV
jgi:hypothetical protein